MRLQIIERHLQRILAKDCIRVEDEGIGAFCLFKSLVIGLAEPHILCIVGPANFGEQLEDHVLAGIRAGIIDNDDLITVLGLAAVNAVQTLGQEGLDVVIDNDNTEVHYFGRLCS